MRAFTDELDRRLAALHEQGLHRALRRVDSAPGPRLEIGGRTFLNFSSNDYLGLANHPALKEAAIKAIEKFGTGSGASRLICGSLAPFHKLEEMLAAFKKTEAALTFSTGYAAALGTITALVGKEDIIVLDKLVHASIVDAAKLSGAKLRIFDHNDLNDLEKILKWANEKTIQRPASGLQPRPHTLIVTESIFSMDGDAAPLREIVALKEKHGAWLMVDEAHATGIMGEKGRGLADELGVSDQIEIQMGTLGKALGASGGFICGSRSLMEFLVNRARSFIFSTAPVPAAAAAATAGIELAQSSEGETRRQQLQQLIAGIFHSHLISTGLQPGEPRPIEHPAASAASTPCEKPLKRLSSSSLHSTGLKPGANESSATKCEISGLEHLKPKCRSAILPIILGDESKAVAAAARLREQNIFVPAIRYPTVARGAARLRITLTAAHSEADVSELASALDHLKSEIQPLKSP